MGHENWNYNKVAIIKEDQVIGFIDVTNVPEDEIDIEVFNWCSINGYYYDFDLIEWEFEEYSS